jgi:predicted dinucleotide-binding enzyme
MTMTTVGFIGAGNIGGTLARLAVDAGYEVVICNSRTPKTLNDLVGELGVQARATTPPEAAAAGDLVVVSIPLRAYPTLPVEPLVGKTVLDTCNYYPKRDGQIAVLDDDSTTSSELMAKHLIGAYVVKVFNNIFYKHLASLPRPAGAADRSALPIAGDDDSAKATATAFLDAIGYDAVDAGPLGAGGRKFSVGTPAYGTLYGDFAEADGTPATVGTVEAALEPAQSLRLRPGGGRTTP